MKKPKRVAAAVGVFPPVLCMFSLVCGQVREVEVQFAATKSAAEAVATRKGTGRSSRGTGFCDRVPRVGSVSPPSKDWRRALVVSGAYPLRAVDFTLAEAFGNSAGDFDPHTEWEGAPG